MNPNVMLIASTPIRLSKITFFYRFDLRKVLVQPQTTGPVFLLQCRACASVVCTFY